MFGNNPGKKRSASCKGTPLKFTTVASPSKGSSPNEVNRALPAKLPKHLVIPKLLKTNPKEKKETNENFKQFVCRLVDSDVAPVKLAHQEPVIVDGPLPVASPSRVTVEPSPRRILSPNSTSKHPANAYHSSEHTMASNRNPLVRFQQPPNAQPTPCKRLKYDDESTNTFQDSFRRIPNAPRKYGKLGFPFKRVSDALPKSAIEQNVSTPSRPTPLDTPFSTSKPRVSFSTSVKVEAEQIPVSIDLTSDTEENTSTEIEDDAISRIDLLEVTGSSSAGVDFVDLCASQVPCSDADDTNGPCPFLSGPWIGKEPLPEQCEDYSTSGSKFRDKDVVAVVSSPGLGSIVLTKADVGCLVGKDWLNDEIINAYMCLLQIRNILSFHPLDDPSNAIPMTPDRVLSPCSSIDCDSDSPDRPLSPPPVKAKPPRIIFYSSFFYALLRNALGGYCYERVRRWGRKRGLASCDVVIFPINVGNEHWCLAAAWLRHRRLRYYDSFGSSNPTCLELLERYLNDEAKEQGLLWLCGEWDKQSVGPPAIPQQRDGSSCGLFVCAAADCLSNGREPGGYSQASMPGIRAAVLQMFRHLGRRSA